MARVIFAGHLVRYPLGGYAWQMAHYLLGFRSRGHDIWFYEDTGELNCNFAYNPLTNEFAPSYEYGIESAAEFFSKIRFGDRWVFVDVDRGLRCGPGANRVETLLHESDLLVSFAPGEPHSGRAISFRDVKEAAQSIERVVIDYEKQCKLARALAGEYFDARNVVGVLLERALS